MRRKKCQRRATAWVIFLKHTIANRQGNESGWGRIERPAFRPAVHVRLSTPRYDIMLLKHRDLTIADFPASQGLRIWVSIRKTSLGWNGRNLFLHPSNPRGVGTGRDLSFDTNSQALCPRSLAGFINRDSLLMRTRHQPPDFHIQCPWWFSSSHASMPIRGPIVYCFLTS